MAYSGNIDDYKNGNVWRLFDWDNPVYGPQSGETADWTSGDWLSYYNDLYSSASASDGKRRDEWERAYNQAWTNYETLLAQEQRAEDVARQNQQFTDSLEFQKDAWRSGLDWSKYAFGEQMKAQAKSQKLEEDKFDYSKKLQQQLFERDDSAMQRAVTDMRQAGISPLAYNPNGENTVGQISGSGASVPSAPGAPGAGYSTPTASNTVTAGRFTPAGDRRNYFLQQVAQVGSAFRDILGSGADMLSNISQASNYNTKSDYQRMFNEEYKRRIDWWDTADDYTKTKLMDALMTNPITKNEKDWSEAEYYSSGASVNLEKVPQIRVAVMDTKSQMKINRANFEQGLKESEARINKIESDVHRNDVQNLNDIQHVTNETNQTTSNIYGQASTIRTQTTQQELNRALTDKSRAEIEDIAKNAVIRMQKAYAEIQNYQSMTKALELQNDFTERTQFLDEYNKYLDSEFKLIEKCASLLGSSGQVILDGARTYRYVQGF